ncbi:hypothetical protein VTH06DRAFT_3438 [Thermothelomyces fergusii]
MSSSEQHPPAPPGQQPQEPADIEMPDQPPPEPQPQPQPPTATATPASAGHGRQQHAVQPENRAGPGQGAAGGAGEGAEGAEGRGKPQQQQQQQQQASPEQSQPQPQQQPQPQPQPQPPPVPGPRAARLQALFAAAAKHTLDKINKDNFGACFPTISQKAPGTLEFVQRQMVERLGSLWHKEFETIMANRQVVERLNELEALVSDAARRRREAEDPNKPPVAPHTLPAETVLSAHLRPHLASQRARIGAALRDTQAANARLWDEVRAQRAEMEALVAAVEKALRDLDGANELLGGLADELAAETRAAEADIRAVRGGGASR